MICKSLRLYLQHEKGTGMPQWRIPSEKSTEIVADTAANVIAALLTLINPQCCDPLRSESWKRQDR